MDEKTVADLQSALNQLRTMILATIGLAILVPVAASFITAGAINAKLEALTSSIASNDEAAGGHGARKTEAKSKPRKAMEMVFYEPMEFLVNLADKDISHYLRATLSIGALLEKSDKAEPAKHGGGHGGKKSVEGEQPEIFRKIKNQEPLIRDLVISIISEYPMATLVELAGKSELKEKIKQRLMEALQTKSLEVFFTAFTLQ